MKQFETKPHVLVVEDDLAVAKLHQEFLSKNGYRVSVCYDGAAAYACFEAAPYEFDLLLTDLQMPKMNGRALCEAVFAIRAQMPVIVVSGYGSAEVVRGLSELGVYKVLAKPASLAAILEETESALRWYRNADGAVKSTNFVDH